MRRKQIFLLLVFCTIVGSHLLFGKTAQEIVIQTQQYLEQRITPLLKQVDPDALVFVKAKAATDQVALPTLPFVFQNVPVENALGEITLRRLDVIILTKLSALPPDVSQLIHSLTQDFVRSPQIHLLPLPSLTQSQLAKSNANTTQLSWMDKLTREKPLLAWAALLVSVVFLILFLGFVIAVLRGTDGLKRVLNGGVDRIADALESTGGRSATTFERETKPEIEPGLSLGSERSALDETLGSLPEEGLLSLLTDAYWGNFDAYAAFLWRHIPVTKKTALFSRWDSCEEYATYLAHLTPHDLSVEQEPCYLKPLPLWFLDNAQLTQLVKKQPPLYYRISSLRRTALSLSAKERVELTKSALSQSLAALPDFVSLPKSKKRTLKISMRIQLNSIQDEKEILALPSLSLEMMENIPSLGWLLRLPQEKIETILRSISSRDLASCWIGPDEMLTQIAEKLPPKKWASVQAYLEQTTPSREAPAYRQLHRLAIDALRSQNEGTHAPTAPKAA